MIEINSTRALDDVWKAPTLVIFKHSNQCGLSVLAIQEVEKLERLHPEIQVHLVSVIESRSVSLEVERRTGVRHESPQVLILGNGAVLWHASHRRVTATAIDEQLQGVLG